MNLTENILKMNYLNKKYDAFHENLMPVVNQNVPLKEMSNKENKKGSLRQFTKRNSYLKKFRKTDNQLFFIRYKCYRDKINHLIRKNKKNYYCKYFNKCSQNIRKM